MIDMIVAIPLALGLGLTTTADIVSTRQALRGGQESGVIMRFADHNTAKLVTMQAGLNSAVFLTSMKLRSKHRYWWPILTTSAFHVIATTHNNNLLGPSIDDMKRRITLIEQQRRSK